MVGGIGDGDENEDGSGSGCVVMAFHNYTDNIHISRGGHSMPLSMKL